MLFFYKRNVSDFTLLYMVREQPMKHLSLQQGWLYTKSSMLGRVLIGCEAPEAGQEHWRDMCSQGQVETAHWHPITPEVV